MARQFSTYQPVAYKGQPVAMPIQIYQPSKQPPLMTPVFLNWTLYNGAGSIPIVGVQVDLSSGAAASPMVLDHIASVSIDNTNSNVPIYVYFPDTQYVVSCGPGACVQANAVTSGRVAIIFGVGFTGGTQPQTIVCFYNTLLPTEQLNDVAFVVPQCLASTINANIPNNTPTRAIAVGDNTINTNFNVVVNTAPTTTKGGAVTFDFAFGFGGVEPVAGCYMYMTSITINLSGIISRAAGAAALLRQSCRFGLGSYTNPGGVLTEMLLENYFSYDAPAGALTQVVNQNLLNLQNMNWKIRCDPGYAFKFGYSQPGTQTAIFWNDGVNYFDVMHANITAAVCFRNEN